MMKHATSEVPDTPVSGSEFVKHLPATGVRGCRGFYLAGYIAGHYPKHYASTAVFLSAKSPRIWVITIRNSPWDLALIDRVDSYLNKQIEKLSWSFLQESLAEHIELPVVLHKTLGVGFDVPGVINTLLRSFITGDKNLTVEELKVLKVAVSNALNAALQMALNQFTADCVDSNLARICGQSLSLEKYNWMAHPNATISRCRCQFVAIYPWFGDLVISADRRTEWALLGGEIDLQKSPVPFLAKHFNVRKSTIRSLAGVTTADVGAYFNKTPATLFYILDCFARDHLPRQPNHWKLLTANHQNAVAIYGFSDSAKVLIRSRLAESCQFSSSYSTAPPQSLNVADLLPIEQLRTGLCAAVHLHIDPDGILDLQRRARVSQRVDKHLGLLSWKRLVSLARCWGICFASEIEENREALSFISDEARLFDYCPDGQHITESGWSIRCMLSAVDIKRYGSNLKNCLSKDGYRATFFAACAAGNSALFIVMDSNQNEHSAAEFHISSVKADGGRSIRFQLAQHTAFQNSAPSSDGVDALNSLMKEFDTPKWQLHASRGLRWLASRKNSAIILDSGSMTSALYFVGLETFRSTFDSQAEGLLQQFSEP